MSNTIIAAKREFLAALAEEQIRFAVASEACRAGTLAKELLQHQPETTGTSVARPAFGTPISQEALLQAEACASACAEADKAMDRLQAAIERIEQLQLN